MNLVGCKALGLMNKLITTPFWCLLESDVHILDMSMHYQRLLRFLKNAAKDATEFMTGSHLPFPEVAIKEDEVFSVLLKPDN